MRFSRASAPVRGDIANFKPHSRNARPATATPPGRRSLEDTGARAGLLTSRRTSFGGAPVVRLDRQRDILSDQSIKPDLIKNHYSAWVHRVADDVLLLVPIRDEII